MHDFAYMSPAVDKIPTMTVQRPSNPKLAKLFDKHLQAGDEIRYADETQLVVFKQNKWGCTGLLLLIALGIITAFIVPLILLLMGAFAPGGQVITYTVKKNGKIKTKAKAAQK